MTNYTPYLIYREATIIINRYTMKRFGSFGVLLNTMLRKVTIVQCQVGRELTREENLLIFKRRPDFVILPEYFNVNPNLRDNIRNSELAVKRLEYLRVLSDRFTTTLIGGTAIETDGHRFYNTCYIFDRGQLLGRFRKTNPTLNELKNGIVPGEGNCFDANGNPILHFEKNGISFSVMICADVLHPANFESRRTDKADLIFVPVTSPFRKNESLREKFGRDRDIFQSGARQASSYVIKCCAVGTLWDGRLQGRSLIAAPWGILTRVPPLDEDKPRIISLVLDIDEIREFRAKSLQLNSEN